MLKCLLWRVEEHVHQWGGKSGLGILMQLFISWVHLCEIVEQVHH